MSDPITRVAESFWVEGPLRLQRRFASLRGVVGDWHGIALLPPLAVAAPAVIGIGAFVVGAGTIGYDLVYSESLFILAAFIAVGAFSTQLGLVGLLGLALGDFFIGQRQWTLRSSDATIIEEIVRVRVPMIITYLLLGVAALFIPRLGKIMSLAIGRWKRIPGQAAWLLITPFVVVVSWIGLRTWAALAPTLIRPRFVWRGINPTVEAIQNLQVEDSTLVAAGVIATLLRQAVLGLTIYWPKLKQRLDILELRGHLLAASKDPLAAPAVPTTGRRFAGDFSSALAASLVLSGILETRILWIILFGVFLLVRLVRSGVITVPPLEAWKRRATAIPIVARIVVLWLLATVGRSVLSDDLIGSYARMSVIVAVGVVVSLLIFPGQPRPVEPAPPTLAGQPS